VLAVLLAVGAHPAGAADESPQTLAEQILSATGVKGGLIVHVGCGDGKLTAALRASDSFVVHGLDRDARDVDTARAYIRSLGVYGPVSVARWDGDSLPYADNLVNLLVAEDLGPITKGEVMRVLAPGGAAHVKRGGRWATTVKQWPEEMDEWGHSLHGPDGNPVSLDVLVGPPRELQWTAGPAWSKKHWGPRISAMVTAGGRLFVVQDETPTSLFNIAAQWVLTARDAFNGVVLWQRNLPEWTAGGWGRVVPRKDNPPAPPGLVLGLWGELSGGSGVRDARRVMVATADRLYLPLSLRGPVSALDPATGEVLRTYEGMAPVREVTCAGGALLIGAAGGVHAVQAETGRELWEAPGSDACTKDGRVYLVGRGGRSVVCVELMSGRREWETDFARAMQETGGKPAADKAGFSGPLRVGASAVLAQIPEGKRAQTIALSTAQGKPLWQKAFGGMPFARGSGAFFIGGLLWSLDSGKGLLTAIAPVTGATTEEIPAPGIRYVGHHARCCQARATCRYIIAKERGADFVDLASGRVSWNNWVRGPCRRGVMPANGLLYAGQHSCRCYTEAALHGFYALAPDRSQRPRAAGAESQLGRQLERGPAYGLAADRQSAPDGGQSGGWPTFRHDATRSGSTPAALPEKLAPSWSASLPGRLSAPVGAGGRVYVSAIDSHTVYALDADTGSVAWSYTAGGRVDSPPTVHGSLVLFGCRDGWAYCLRADNGGLVWRFRAAPDERMVGAHGQLESAWPVHGSILVKPGPPKDSGQAVAYFVAGRSSFLDGGLYIYALDPATGRVLHTRRLEGPWPKPEVGTEPDIPNRGFTSPGALPDVLVADATSVYLRHLRLDPTLRTMEDMQPNFYKSPALSGENRGGDHKFWDNLVEAPRHALFTDPAWFNRSFFQNFPGLRLYATTGLLDPSWHRRMYWSYGQVVGQYIVFRGNMAYAVQVFATSPREGGSSAGDGYVVYAGRTAEREDREKLFALRPDQSVWRIRVPFRPVAMVLAGETLWLAGPPDRGDPAEALAALEGKQGAVLWAVAAADGKRLSECRLDSPPISDGMAAAYGRLYVATLDGRVLCMGQGA
jgi:outer membrane protein assembly factor BamB